MLLGLIRLIKQGRSPVSMRRCNGSCGLWVPVLQTFRGLGVPVDTTDSHSVCIRNAAFYHVSYRSVLPMSMSFDS